MRITIFVPKIWLIVSVILESPSVFAALVDGVVSVSQEVFVLDVVLEAELSEKITRASVRVDLLDLPLGTFEMMLIEQFSKKRKLRWSLAKNQDIFGLVVFIVGIFFARLI